MTLSFYFARRFLRSFAIVFLVFFGVLLLADLVDQLRRFAGKGIGLAGAAELAALNVPESLYGILPLIVIFASITLFLGLARTSELVVVRASGRSGLRFLVSPVITAILLGCVTVAVLNPLVAGLSRKYEETYARYARGSESVLSVSASGLWLRQGSPDGQTVVQAARANLDGTKLYAPLFLTFAPDGVLLQRIEADEALLVDGAWRLVNAKFWNMTDANPEHSAVRRSEADLPTDLTRERIRDSFGQPSAIPIWQLPSYIDRIEAAGFSAQSHRVWFQMELAKPLLLAAMVLVAAGFTMRHARFGRTGQMALLAVLGGFAIFFLRNFAQVLGENGQIPVALAAWSPPVTALMLSLGLLLHLEDG